MKINLKFRILFHFATIALLGIQFSGCAKNNYVGNVEPLKMRKIRHDVEVKLTNITYSKSFNLSSVRFEVNNKRDTAIEVRLICFCVNRDIDKVLNDPIEKVISEYEAIYIDTYPLNGLSNTFYPNGEIMFRPKNTFSYHCEYGDIEGLVGALLFPAKEITPGSVHIHVAK